MSGLVLSRRLSRCFRGLVVAEMGLVVVWAWGEGVGRFRFVLLMWCWLLGCLRMVGLMVVIRRMFMLTARCARTGTLDVVMVVLMAGAAIRTCGWILG